MARRSIMLVLFALALGACEEEPPRALDMTGNLNGDVVVNAVHDLGSDGR